MSSSKYGPKLTRDPQINEAILNLVASWKVPDHADDIAEIVASIYRLSQQDLSSSDVVLFKRAFGELRYAQNVFAPYRGAKKVCIFGSARTRPDSPVYQCAVDFGRLMSEAGFMTITGAGDGIMGAAQHGAGREKSFGLNILLPFEQHANEVIRDDPKLVTFRYFFTRKLTFLREAAAVVVFPGGFGTLDEAMEVLTLMQTGKARLIPLLLIDKPGGTFWKNYLQYLREHLLDSGLISPEDFNLFRLSNNVTEARDEIVRFYHNFHSYRFVGPNLVIRLQRALPEEKLGRLREEFKDILGEAQDLHASAALPEESNETDIAHLPRLCLSFNRIQFGRLRLLLDRVNEA